MHSRWLSFTVIKSPMHNQDNGELHFNTLQVSIEAKLAKLTIAMKILQHTHVCCTLYGTCPHKGEQKQCIQVMLKDMYIYKSQKCDLYAIRIIRNGFTS